MSNLAPIIRDVTPKDYSILIPFLNDFDEDKKGEKYWTNKIKH